jgi:hypothetical protein
MFLTSYTLAGGEWSVSCHGWFTVRERAPSTHWMRGWVDLRAGLENVEKRKFLILLGLELRLLGCQAHSQSLYRLCYPGCRCCVVCSKLILVNNVLGNTKERPSIKSPVSWFWMMRWERLKISPQAAMFLTCIRVVPGSNTGRDATSSWLFSWPTSVLLNKCRSRISNFATYFPIHY